MRAYCDRALEGQDPTSAYNPAVSSTWNYQYDAIGNSVENKGDDHVITYTASGLVKEVRTQAGVLLSSYAYDGQGKRILKTNHDAAGVLTSRTWYAYDASGGLAASYEQEAAAVSAVQAEVPIGGGSRIGVLYRQVNNTALYELTVSFPILRPSDRGGRFVSLYEVQLTEPGSSSPTKIQGSSGYLPHTSQGSTRRASTVPGTAPLRPSPGWSSRSPRPAR